MPHIQHASSAEEALRKMLGTPRPRNSNDTYGTSLTVISETKRRTIIESSVSKIVYTMLLVSMNAYTLVDKQIPPASCADDVPSPTTKIAQLRRKYLSS